MSQYVRGNMRYGCYAVTAIILAACIPQSILAAPIGYSIANLTSVSGLVSANPINNKRQIIGTIAANKGVIWQSGVGAPSLGSLWGANHSLCVEWQRSGCRKFCDDWS